MVAGAHCLWWRYWGNPTNEPRGDLIYVRQCHFSRTISLYVPNMPFRVTMTCFGCSSTGRDRTNAATSSAVFHFANWPRRFWPAQTLVWIIFKKSWPDRGLKIKMAPSINIRFSKDVANTQRLTDRLRGQIPFECFVSVMNRLFANAA